MSVSKTTANDEAIKSAYSDMIYLGTGVYRQSLNENGSVTLQHVPFEEMWSAREDRDVQLRQDDEARLSEHAFLAGKEAGEAGRPCEPPAWLPPKQQAEWSRGWNEWFAEATCQEF